LTKHGRTVFCGEAALVVASLADGAFSRVMFDVEWRRAASRRR